MRPSLRFWWMAVLLLACVPVRAQDPPPYDHPLFTAPVQTMPARTVDLQHLQLALRPDLVRGSLRATAILRLVPQGDSLRHLALPVQGLQVSQVAVGVPDSTRTPIPFTPGDTLRITLQPAFPPGTPLDLAITYTATPRTGVFYTGPPPAGTTTGRTTSASRRQVWATGIPDGWRAWLPLPEAPGDRATLEVTLTLPAPYQAFLPGIPAGTEKHRDGTQTWRFTLDTPLDLHTLGFTAGPFAVARDTLALPPGDTLVVSYAAVQPATGAFAHTFRQVPDMLRFFTEQLGTAFPSKHLAFVAVPDLPTEIADSPGLVLLPAPLPGANTGEGGPPEVLLAAAVARQWFGAAVSPDFPSEQWLFDGLATYLGALYLKARDTTAFGLFMEALADAYRTEAAQYRRPLVWDQWEHPLDLHDAHSWAKSAWVLHLLRQQVGDPVFWQALRGFLHTHTGGVAQTGDFVRAVADAGGPPLQEFMDQWVYGAGHPVLDIRYTYDLQAEQLKLTFRQLQEGFLVPEVFTMALTVAVHTLDGAISLPVSLHERAHTFTFPLAMPPRFVEVDPGAALLAETRLVQPVSAWVAQVREAASPVARLQAARALTGFVDEPDLLLGLRAALSNEPVAAVRAAIVATMGQLPPSASAERALLTAVQDADAGVRAAALTALDVYTGSTAVTQAAVARANTDPDARVQAAAVRTVARTGGAEAFGVVRSALVTPSYREVIRRAALDVLPLTPLPPAEQGTLALTHSQGDQPTPVRLAAVGALQALADWDRRVQPRLVQLLDDPVLPVRLAAVAALGAVGDGTVVAELARRLPQETHRPLVLALRTALRHLAARGHTSEAANR